MRPVVEPEVTEDQSCIGGTIHRHPAYGQIRASRVSGSASLYASDFRHQHYVTISICTSYFRRSLSTDWYHGDKEFVEVALSESQWGQFVSSLNVGSGTPCTIQRMQEHPRYGKFDGTLVPSLPDPKPVTEQFHKELQKYYEEVLTSLKAMESQLANADKPMGKTAQQELAKGLSQIRSRLTGNSKFVADQFNEHVEQTVDKAKAEINAYALHQMSVLAVGEEIQPLNLQISLDKPE